MLRDIGCSVFGEALFGCHSDVSCCVASPSDENYCVRDATYNSGVRHLEHRWSVYDYHVELSLEFRNR